VFAASKDGQEFLRQLVSLVGARNNHAEVGQVVSFIRKVNEPALSFSLVRALGDGLKRSDAKLEQADETGGLKAVFADAQKIAADDKSPEETRVAAIQLLGYSTYSAVGPMLVPLLKTGNQEIVQLAAISTLAHFPESRIASDLAENWTAFSQRAKSQTVAVLLSRPERAIVLLKAIQSGPVQQSDLTTAQTKFLRNHANAQVRGLALQVLGAARQNKLQSVIDAFQPALGLSGNAAEGRKIFEQRCISCHHLGGVGFAVGPDLLSARSNGKEKLLISILDPSREVAPQYMAFDIETKDGESYVGTIANEGAGSVTVRQAFGKEDVIQRSNIKGMKSQGQSLMPEGLESGLKPQDLANLLEFITTASADK
jgi:putative heme-binding domain-containing protein